MNSMLTGCVTCVCACTRSTELCVMLVQWSKVGDTSAHVQTCMFKCVGKQTHHSGLSLWHVAPGWKDYCAISVATEVQGTMAGVKGRVYIMHCSRSEAKTDKQTEKYNMYWTNSYPYQYQQRKEDSGWLKCTYNRLDIAVRGQWPVWEEAVSSVPLWFRLAETHKHSKSQ